MGCLKDWWRSAGKNESPVASCSKDVEERHHKVQAFAGLCFNLRARALRPLAWVFIRQGFLPGCLCRITKSLKGHMNIRILQLLWFLETALPGALEPECRILVFVLYCIMFFYAIV